MMEEATLPASSEREPGVGAVCCPAPLAVLAAVCGLGGEAELPSEPIKAAVRGPEKGATHGLHVYTYTVDSKRAPDDKLYARSPWLREFMPRGFSVVVEKKEDGKTCEVIAVMQGPRKFEGVSLGDNDDVPDTDEDAQIFNRGQVEAWQAAGELAIVREDKENGKFAVLKMFKHRGQLLAVGGSKTQHVIVSPDCIDAIIADAKSRPLLSQIFAEVRQQWEALSALADVRAGATVVGELCDGLHFVPLETERPQVKWFGLFERGLALSPVASLELLYSLGLPAVSYSLLDPTTDLNLTIQAARCGTGEGYVMYFTNTRTGEVVLAKNKTAVYIVKRMTREMLRSFGYALYDRLPKRIIETAAYHQLSTTAAVRLCGSMFGLMEWMMAAKVPVSAIAYYGGGDQVPNPKQRGFANVWRRYQAETREQVPDLSQLTLQDVSGAFDANEFMQQIKARPQQVGAGGAAAAPGSDPPRVVFIQGLQGSGKSALGGQLVEALRAEGAVAEVVEQDQFEGCSTSCRSYIERLLSARAVNFAIVTRCNMNKKQYSAYETAALRLGARVSFLTPHIIDKQATMLVCLASILERTDGGADEGLVALGHGGLPKAEVCDILRKNLKSFDPHPLGQRFQSLVGVGEKGKGLPGEPPRYDAASDVMWRYVEEHAGALRALRRPLGEVTAEVKGLLLTTPPDAFTSLPFCDTILIAFYPSPTDDARLAAAAQALNPAAFSSFHMTQFVKRRTGKKRGSGGEDGNGDGESYVAKQVSQQGSRVRVAVTHLVTQVSDGHMAFRVSVPLAAPPSRPECPPPPGLANPPLWIMSGRPHMTAFVPEGGTARASVGFVYSESDEDVTVQKLPEPLEMELVCRWM